MAQNYSAPDGHQNQTNARSCGVKRNNGDLCSGYGRSIAAACSIRHMELTATVTLDSDCQRLALGWRRADSNRRSFSGELRPRSHGSRCVRVRRRPVGRWWGGSRRDGRGRAAGGSEGRISRVLARVSTRHDVGDAGGEPRVKPRRSTRQQRRSQPVSSIQVIRSPLEIDPLYCREVQKCNVLSVDSIFKN